MVSPLCASMCGASRIHPYSPCSRVFRNLLYLRIEEIPGARQAPEIAQLSSDALRLNQERNIDYQAIINLKLRAIELLWSRFGGDERFERYCRSEGVSLRRFAIFNALVERHGAGWRRWPEEYRHPKSPAVERFASENEDRVRFRQWIQWLIDEQLREAATTLPLMMDLPIGFDPDGADAWAYQDLLAFGARIGAPPDDFNPNGQEWGLPPFIPHKLRASGYRPFIETVRASLRHASALRIDHVMGLSRLYWVPEGRSPREGTYIRYSFEEQLAVLAVESHRARAWILGEDLGTVEDHVRERLAACRIPSYRLACFEQRLPRDYPPLSFAAVTTHDLPTLAGLLNGRELEMRRTIGIPPHEEALKAMRARMDRLTENQAAAAHDDALVDIYRSLAHAPSAVVVATLEDALAVNEPPNRPGTTHEWPNWSLALPLMLDEISRHDLPRRLAAALKR
jgi:4-alpha-glucanotransferase